LPIARFDGVVKSTQGA